MPKYQTKQRTLLLDFLNQHPDELLSAKEIAENLKADNISVSSVYRNLADLGEDGMVVKHIPNGTREVYYRYIGAEKCKGHIHVSCVKCGKTFHIKKDYVAALSDSLKKDENFILSTEETILYGICGDCQGA